jgi:4-amino-4-deoxy-L-arabinose transferase-like glycosyltransferase
MVRSAYPVLTAVLLGMLCAAAGVVASLAYLPHAALWIDEATQLAGLTLDPSEVVRWLSGWSHPEFGQSDDRMPPLSYWLGWAWAQFFGLGEVQERLLGIVLVALATLLIFGSARRSWGALAGAASGLLFALSPNVVVNSVEIRAYPLLLLTSAATFCCLIRYLLDVPLGSWRVWLAGMTVCSILAVFTHFFGLVMAGGVFLAALVLTPRRGRQFASVLFAIVIVGLATAGIAPFVLAAIGVSGGSVDGAPDVAGEGRLVDLGKLAYRLFVHPTMSLSSWALALAAVGIVVSFATALAPKKGSTRPSAGLIVALVSGLLVVAIAHLSQTKFAAATPSYSLWTAPAFALVLGSGLGASSMAVRRAAGIAVSLVVAAYLYGDAQLAAHGDYFAHSPHTSVSAFIRRVGAERVALIHDKVGPPIWMVYSPVRQAFGGAVRQYALIEGTESGPMVVDYPDRREAAVDPAGLTAEYLVVVLPAMTSTGEIVQQLRHGIHPLGDGPVALALKADPRWALVEESTRVAFVSADIDLFRKVSAQ